MHYIRSYMMSEMYDSSFDQQQQGIIHKICFLHDVCHLCKHALEFYYIELWQITIRTAETLATRSLFVY